MRGWSIPLCFCHLKSSFFLCFVSAYICLKTNQAMLGLLPSPSLTGWLFTLLDILLLHLPFCHKRAVWWRWRLKNKKKARLYRAGPNYPVILLPQQQVSDMFQTELIGFPNPNHTGTELFEESLIDVRLLSGREKSDGVILSTSVDFRSHFLATLKFAVRV